MLRAATDGDAKVQLPMDRCADGGRRARLGARERAGQAAGRTGRRPAPVPRSRRLQGRCEHDERLSRPRAAACDRCHGANQEAWSVSLVESLKTLSKEDFIKTVRDGRLDKGMMSFSSSKMVMDNIDNLYAYLKGRSNGDITRAKVEELKQ
jgi:cytochrome c553